MAYRQFGPTAELSADSQPASESPPAGLGSSEWSVVEAARKDGLWSINPEGFVQKLVRIVAGIRPPLPLANERLEALRRFAVLAWNKGMVGAGQVCDFIEAGFSRNDAQKILDYIGRQRKIDSWPRGLA